MSIFTSGFEEPGQNYFRLPNAWLELLVSIRKTYRNRSLAPIKVLEYILKHTWGWQRFESGIVLSLDELQNGKRWGRRRTDAGTGLSINAIRKSLSTLEALGYIEKLGFNCYRPKLKPATSDYFKLPKEWTNITVRVRSSLTVLMTEYFMRHAWGFQNPQGVWLDAEELQNGRKYADGRRYDSGVGGDIKSIHAALDEAAELGLVVWTERCETGRLYNLHLAGMDTGMGGEYLGALPWETLPESAPLMPEVIETIDGDNEPLWEKPLAGVLAEEACLPDILTGLGIYGAARSELTARNISIEQAAAWALYVAAAENLANPAGLLVKLLRSGEDAPPAFTALVHLPLGSWIEILAQPGPLAQNEYLPHAHVRLWESVLGARGKNRLPDWLARFVNCKSLSYFDFDAVKKAEPENPIAEAAPVEEKTQPVLGITPEEAAPETGTVNTWKEAVNIPAGADDRVLLKDTVFKTLQNTEKQTGPTVVFQNLKKELQNWLPSTPIGFAKTIALRPRGWTAPMCRWGDLKFCFAGISIPQNQADSSAKNRLDRVLIKAV